MIFSLDAHARQKHRQKLTENEYARAAVRAARAGRRVNCVGSRDFEPAHAGQPDGCTDDGSGCLCECHDPKAPQ